LEAAVTTIEVLLVTFQILVGLILMGGVPWAFILEKRLARIEAAIQEAIKGELTAIRTEIASNRMRGERHSDVIRKYDRRLMRVENKCGIDSNENN